MPIALVVPLQLNLNPLILNELSLVGCHTNIVLVPAVIIVLFDPAPIRDMFLRIVRLLFHVEDPAGTNTVSPSDAELTALVTSACEVLAALMVAARAPIGANRHSASDANVRPDLSIFIQILGAAPASRKDSAPAAVSLIERRSRALDTFL